MKSVRPLLGTYVSIRIDHADASLCAHAVDAAFAAMTVVHERMSAFDPDSDLARIHRDAHLEPVVVHPWTAEVIRIAQDLHAASNGLFDPGIAPQLAAWDLLPATTLETVPSGMAHLHLQGDTVSCAWPTRIDLGGIAKGYAVDRAVDALRACGIDSACVNAGGDLRVIGSTQEPIYVRDPVTLQPVLAGLLQDGAFASSAIYYSRQQHQGHEVSAIVNPLNSEALTCGDSFSIIAPLCVLADGLTKVLALSRDVDLPCFAHFGAQALITPAS